MKDKIAWTEERDIEVSACGEFCDECGHMQLRVYFNSESWSILQDYFCIVMKKPKLIKKTNDKYKRTDFCKRKEVKDSKPAQCTWVRAFDGHFNISCVDKTHGRGHGPLIDDCSVKFCPYCGLEISVIEST